MNESNNIVLEYRFSDTVSRRVKNVNPEMAP
jgi:hypothetical protein